MMCERPVQSGDVRCKPADPHEQVVELQLD